MTWFLIALSFSRTLSLSHSFSLLLLTVFVQRKNFCGNSCFSFCQHCRVVALKMGRHSCCYKQKLRKGLWSPEEDEKLIKHISKNGHGCWSSVPKLAGFHSLSLSLYSSNSARHDFKTVVQHFKVLPNAVSLCSFHDATVLDRTLKWMVQHLKALLSAAG